MFEQIKHAFFMTNYQRACVHCDAVENHIRIEVLAIISRNSKEGVVYVYRNVETKNADIVS